MADDRGGERPARRPRKAGIPPAGATRAKKTATPAADDVDGPDAAAPAARSRAPGARSGGGARARKSVGAKAVVKKATAKKAAANKAAAKKAPARKAPAVKKAAVKKAAVKKATVKKATVKKATVKKATKVGAEEATGPRRKATGTLRTPILADLPPPSAAEVDGRAAPDQVEAPDQGERAPDQVEQALPPPEPPASEPSPAAEAAEVADAPTPAPSPPPAPPAPARPRAPRALVLAIVALVLVGVVVGVLLLTNVLGPSGVKYDELRPGDCLEKPGERFVRAERVDCAKPHDLEVFALVTDPAPRDARYPGPEILEREATVACLPQFQTYVGIPFEQSELRFTGYVPTERNWEEHNRLLVCTLSARTGRLTGTVKDSRR